jgi:hypothetical protein
LQTVLGYVPILQPELDMVLWKGSTMFGVELKVFSDSPHQADRVRLRSFYEGIGQALALHRFGFDFSGLWLLFRGAGEDVMRRGSTAWAFVRETGLPLDFSYFKVDSRFRPMQYAGSQTGYELLPIDDPRFRIRFKYRNPIQGKPEQRVIRAALELWFDGVLTDGALARKLGHDAPLGSLHVAPRVPGASRAFETSSES